MPRGVRIVFTKEQLDTIKEMYSRGTSAGELGRIFGVSHTVITRKVSSWGIKRTKNEARSISRKKCNIHFFDTIDTEPKAYWLGFLYADGNVTDCKQPSMQVCLSAKDSDHLELFSQTLDSEYRVSYYNYGVPVVQLRIPRREIVDALVTQGCFPRKSLELKPPTLDQVPVHLVRHFIRGYIDGDGCFSKSGQLIVIGTQEFLEWVSVHIPFEHKANVIKPKGKNIWRLGVRVRGQKRFDVFYPWLYADATVWLSRKRQRLLART